MRNAHQFKTSTVITLILGVIIFGLCIGWANQVLQPKGRTKCSDFGSYEDIVSAFNDGSYWLDGNADGIPCAEREPNGYDRTKIHPPKRPES